MRVDSVLRVEGQRNETIEPARLILQLPQPHKMIDAFLERFDVTIQHGRIRSDAHLVNSPRDLEPPCSGYLVTGNQRSRPLREDLGASARTTSHASGTQLCNHPLKRLARDPR